MLTTEALDEALSLTQSFDNKDIVLEPIEGTPLAELVKQTIILSNEVDTGFDLKASTESTNVIELGVNGSGHDVIMDEIVKAGADAVRGHISFAKNVVAPKVGEYISLVEEDIAQLPVSGLNKFEIKQYKLPEVFEAPGFRESLTLFKETPFEEPTFDLDLADLEEQTIQGLLQTGSGSIDGLIQDWLARVGMDFIYNVYSTVFQIKPNEDPNYSKVVSLRKLMDDKVTGEDFTLAVYLLANKLFDNPPEDTPHSLEEYNERIIKLRNQSGNKLYRLDLEVEQAYRNDKLVKAVISNHEVLVYTAVYEDWITGGGDNDILLGSLVSESTYYTLDRLMEDAEALKARWEAYKKIEEKAAINNKFVYIKESLTRNFNKLLAECENKSAAERSTCNAIFKEELALVTLDEISQICDVSLKLVSRSMFYNTDAERILTSIEKNAKENPSITPREAALIATIELITDWVSAQMKPVSAY